MGRQTTRITEKYKHLYPNIPDNYNIDISYLDMRPNMEFAVVLPLEVNVGSGFYRSVEECTKVNINHTDYYLTHLSPLAKALNGSF